MSHPNPPEAFSFESMQIDNAYDALNAQFQTLNFELQETNHKLQGKVAELDILADYLKSLLDNIAQGILFIDMNGTITTYNKAAEAMLGIPKDDILFRPFWNNFKDDAFGFSLQQALREQTASTYWATYQNSELEIATTFSLRGDNAPTKSLYQKQGMIVMIRDVTEIRHLQILAARADRMKALGEMAARVAHEIRNPLGGIKGFASLLKRDLAGNPELEKMADYIVEGTDSLNRLVGQILQYARPVQPHLEKTNLVATLQEVQQYVLADSSIDTQKIAIAIEAISEISISIDASLFKSALLNLVVNAVQAMPEGGKITLSAYEEMGYVILSIADTGTGISEENLSKLYSPFFTTKPEGNGLGLIEVQKVVQAHGGTIDVSSSLGKGTAFVIKLPKR